MSEPQVIYESKDLLVVNKPGGLQVHAARISGSKARDPRPAEPTLVDWLLEKYPEVKSVGDDPSLRPGIVHRLDKETSGVMLVARTQGSFEYLKSLFQSRAIVKTYIALASGRIDPGKGIIDKPIGMKSGTLKRSVHSTKMAKAAVTEYEVLKHIESNTMHNAPCTMLRVMPKTGRTHQIRVHLASIGHPIIGDKLYGSKTSLAAFGKMRVPRLMLHASSIEFTTEDGKRMRFEAELPEDFKKTADFLGG